MERINEEIWLKSFLNQFEVARNSTIIKLLLLLSPTGQKLQTLVNSCSKFFYSSFKPIEF